MIDVEGLRRRLAGADRYGLGFPRATDQTFEELAPLMAEHLVNHAGNPYEEGLYRGHCKDVERQVIDWVADLVRAPVDDRAGFVANGSSDGTLHALRMARRLLPGAVVYYSAAAHHSVETAVDVLGMSGVRVRIVAGDGMDMQDLADQVGLRRDRPGVVVCTAGTTMAEAHDCVREARQVLNDAQVRGWVHVDGALSLAPLALLDPAARRGVDFVDGADSVVVSGHKFFGTTVPCAVLVTRASDVARETPVPYLGTAPATIGCSRNGFGALQLWQVIARLGHDGLRARAEESRRLAAYVHGGLLQIGVEAIRHREAFTVLLKAPEIVRAKWGLGVDGRGWSHVIAMPGVSAGVLDEFTKDMAAIGGGRGAMVIPLQAAVHLAVS